MIALQKLTLTLQRKKKEQEKQLLSLLGPLACFLKQKGPNASIPSETDFS